MIADILFAIASGDYDAILILADALEESGDMDGRADKCRATVDKLEALAEQGCRWCSYPSDGVCRECGGTKRNVYGMTMTVTRDLLFAFPDYAPPECLIANWRMEEAVYSVEPLFPGARSGLRVTSNIKARADHKRHQRRFKAVLKEIRIDYAYRPSDGSLAIAFPSPEQFVKLRAARRKWDAATKGEEETMFASLGSALIPKEA